MQRMNGFRRASASGIVGIVLMLATGACAASEPAALPERVEACLLCHDDPAVTAILHGPHAVAADARTGFVEQGCGSCHGASEAHLRRPPRGEARAAPDRAFGKQAATPLVEQNAACIDCHRGSQTLHWWGSAHEAADVGCVDCHRVHQGRDPMADAQTQTDACLACHTQTRGEFARPSRHPILDGRMACGDCHAAHGSTGPALLSAGTVNDTCTTCHAEMRGPFLWEHPPVREDCLNCHQAHGAVHRPLLTQRAPWLCQTCHMAQFHPSTALSGTGLPGETLPSGSQNLLGRNCMNCHVQVHGSNHPSGAGQTR